MVRDCDITFVINCFTSYLYWCLEKHVLCDVAVLSTLFVPNFTFSASESLCFVIAVFSMSLFVFSSLFLLLPQETRTS